MKIPVIVGMVLLFAAFGLGVYLSDSIDLAPQAENLAIKVMW